MPIVVVINVYAYKRESSPQWRTNMNKCCLYRATRPKRMQIADCIHWKCKRDKWDTNTNKTMPAKFNEMYLHMQRGRVQVNVVFFLRPFALKYETLYFCFIFGKKCNPCDFVGLLFEYIHSIYRRDLCLFVRIGRVAKPCQCPPCAAITPIGWHLWHFNILLTGTLTQPVNSRINIVGNPCSAIYWSRLRNLSMTMKLGFFYFDGSLTK